MVTTDRNAELRVREIVLTCQYVLSDHLLLEEFERQMQKWGSQEASALQWQSFIIEEIGESAKALNQGRPEDATIELVQAMALCIQMIRYMAISVGGTADRLNDIEEFMGRVVTMYNSEPDDKEPPF
jgi:hypothetical protein